MPTPVSTPPRPPTATDTELLASLQALELAARDLYQAAIDAGADDGSGVLTTLRGNHQGAANLISGLIGGAAPQARDDATYDELVADFESADVAAVAVAGKELEEALVNTHVEAIGSLEGTAGAARVAAILMIESRAAAVLASLAGQGDDLDALLVNETPPLTLPEQGS